jgi:hypothetical protein
MAICLFTRCQDRQDLVRLGVAKGTKMSELDFALDGLYAAGWWPSKSDRCLQSQDQRWYPTPQAIHQAFTRAGIDLKTHTTGIGRTISISWAMQGHGSETVIARTEEAALLLAFTHLFQCEHRSETSPLSA